MEKILLTAISIICIMTSNLGLTGCGTIKDKSNISENHPTTISKPSGTSIPNSSTAPATMIPTQPSSSPSGSTTKAIDYNQFIKKVWVVKNWTTNDAYDNYFSFSIYKIANGKLEGKFTIGGIAEPDGEFYSPGYLGNIDGTIHNDTVECQFSDKKGNRGNIKLLFKSKDEIEATIKFEEKSQKNKDKSLDGTFLFRPYNLKDFEGFSPFTNQSFTIDLNSWGTVNFVSGKMLGGNHIPTLVYLTNQDGDIFYYITSFNNVEIYAVSFKDLNKDGLKDIIIIYGVEEDSSSQLAKIFFQKPDGSFYGNGELNQEINESVKNKDIKTVTDYLSKKF